MGLVGRHLSCVFTLNASDCQKGKTYFSKMETFLSSSVSNLIEKHIRSKRSNFKTFFRYQIESKRTRVIYVNFVRLKFHSCFSHLQN